jgi:hypothetical protein
LKALFLCSYLTKRECGSKGSKERHQMQGAVVVAFTVRDVKL